MAREQFVVCVKNKGYVASLGRRKIYVALPDPVASRHGQIRVVDESGENYLYPKSYFIPIILSQAARKVVISA